MFTIRNYVCLYALTGLNSSIFPMHAVTKLKTEEDLEDPLNTILEEEKKKEHKI